MPTNSSQTKVKGLFGEAQVVAWLKAHDYEILAQNYTSKMGEIDIIAQKGDVVSFVEVKMRLTAYFALSELITPSKQKKIIMTAKRYIALNSNSNHVYQFDVALLEKISHDNFKIEYLPNAFYGSEFY